MDLEVFIGDLENERFNYENGDWDGNIPKRISCFFPKSNDTFRYVLSRISNGNITGKKTDWGAWVAIMYPKDVLKLFVNFYDEYHLGELQEILRKLDKDKQYGLVACEIG